MTIPTRIIGGLLAAAVLAIAAMYVLQLGPFRPPPSAAAKAQPKVQAAVTSTQAKASADVAKAETKTQAAAVTAEKKAETHVANIRRTTARAAPADVPDVEFYRGVCESQLYAGDPGCRGYSSEP